MQKGCRGKDVTGSREQEGGKGEGGQRSRDGTCKGKISDARGTPKRRSKRKSEKRFE